MLAIDATAAAFRMARLLPSASQAGLAVLGFGILYDLVLHAGAGFDHHHDGMSGPEISAHLVIFAGMVLLLLGVVVDGVRSIRRTSGTTAQGSSFDAPR
jgi:hypothetical protein